MEPPDAAAPLQPDASTCPASDPLWEDVDLATFTDLLLPAGEPVTLEVLPSEPATYWELRRYADLATSPEILASAGEKCAGATDPNECRRRLNELYPTADGFGQVDGLEGYRSHLIVNRGDSNTILSTREELVAFLGDIDTPAEAALIAHADEFSVQNVRVAEDGYELLVYEYTEFCSPIVIQRVLLLVTPDGSTTERRRQNYHVDCLACI